MAQSLNAIYVLNGDYENSHVVHIYDPALDQWTIQKVTYPIGNDAKEMIAILDHDTNVFCEFIFAPCSSYQTIMLTIVPVDGMLGGNLHKLDMKAIKAAEDTALKWELVGTPNFNMADYRPIMAVAENRIHFLNVPGNAAGQANIFDIPCKPFSLYSTTSCD